MDLNIIKNELKKFTEQNVSEFLVYLQEVYNAKKKGGDYTNRWWLDKTQDKKLAYYFKQVSKENLKLDGKEVALVSTGLSYSYIAYKNKMLMAYPDSKIDIQIVKEGDVFNFKKENGKVLYTHEISNPFSNKGIIGVYCVIKNKRGEFLNILSKSDIDKHRSVSKMDYIWDKWFDEMALKTVIKKACKQHFADIFVNIEEQDNHNYDLENPIDINFKVKKEIENAKTLKELSEVYKNTKNKTGLTSLFAKRKKELENV